MRVSPWKSAQNVSSQREMGTVNISRDDTFWGICRSQYHNRTYVDSSRDNAFLCLIYPVMCPKRMVPQKQTPELYIGPNVLAPLQNLTCRHPSTTDRSGTPLPGMPIAPRIFAQKITGQIFTFRAECLGRNGRRRSLHCETVNLIQSPDIKSKSTILTPQDDRF